jgi:hypothetical protein
MKEWSSRGDREVLVDGSHLVLMIVGQTGMVSASDVSTSGDFLLPFFIATVPNRGARLKRQFSQWMTDDGRCKVEVIPPFLEHAKSRG